MDLFLGLFSVSLLFVCFYSNKIEILIYVASNIMQNQKIWYTALFFWLNITKTQYY